MNVLDSGYWIVWATGGDEKRQEGALPPCLGYGWNNR